MQVAGLTAGDLRSSRDENDVMSLSAFDDKSHQPEAPELKKILGKSAALWTGLVTHIEETYAPVTAVWNFAGAKFGWSLRLKQKDRIVLYLTPQDGTFLAGIVLGDRALAAARKVRLPAAILELLDAAPRYAEGTGIRVPVSSRSAAAAVQRLVDCKMDT